ncbi:hypothetical protein, partial [Streptomyces sp. NPDC001275]
TKLAPTSGPQAARMLPPALPHIDFPISFLDAMGRVCSALPGAMADGMGAPRAHPYGPAVGDGAPAIPVPADPPPEALF